MDDPGLIVRMTDDLVGPFAGGLAGRWAPLTVDDSG
jgi:hypothetical protein